MRRTTTLQTNSTASGCAPGAAGKSFNGCMGRLSPAMRAALLAEPIAVIPDWRAGTKKQLAQRYVLAWHCKGFSEPFYACVRRSAGGLSWSRNRKPLEFSQGDLVLMAPRLKLFSSELRAVPVKCIRVRALDQGYQKKLGINFRVVHVGGGGDFRHTPLSAVIRGENAPYLRCLHLVPFFGSI